MRTCPRDQTPLERIVMEKVELDRCPACNGIWCDQNELGELAGTVEDLPGYHESLEGVRTQCPNCEALLMRLYYSPDRSIVVDVCEACQGVWLDDNELNEIICKAHGVTR